MMVYVASSPVQDYDSDAMDQELGISYVWPDEDSSLASTGRFKLKAVCGTCHLDGSARKNNLRHEDYSLGRERRYHGSAPSVDFSDTCAHDDRGLP